MTGLFRRVRPEQVRELTLVFILVAVAAFFSTQIPNYLSARTFTDISTGLEVIAVVAVGETLVVLTRNIDLSVGSVVGLVAYFVGTLLANNPGLPAPFAIAVAIALGSALGAINGAIVAFGRVPAVVATLGTLAIYRVALVERLFAIGSNPEAARVAGLPIQRDVFVAFLLSGALSGLAGFLFLVRFGNITVVAGQGLELQAVAAVVVGGVNIFGGSGSMVGAFLGAALINLLQQSLLRWPAVSAFLQDAILGVLILLAVASDKVILERLRTRWVRARRRDDERAAATAAEQAVPGA